MTPVTDVAALPIVLRRQDLCALLRISARTLHRRLRAGVFPVACIPDMPGCWFRDDVLGHLRGTRGSRYFGRARRVASRPTVAPRDPRYADAAMKTNQDI